MPLSTYFDVPKFRGIDDNATADTLPLTSALEAQLACGQEWLHRNAGGATPLLKAPASLSATGYNNTFHVAARWASLLYTPFLVTRGLRQIRLTMLGTVEALNISVRLELLGFKSTESVWLIGGSPTANVVRTITLTLDEPADVEYETDLILWGQSRLTAPSTSNTSQAIIESGFVEIKPTALSSNPNRTLAALTPIWDGTGFPAHIIYETLLRNNSAQTFNGSGTTGAAILSERVGGVTYMGEIELGRITTRSFFVEAFSE